MALAAPRGHAGKAPPLCSRDSSARRPCGPRQPEASQSFLEAKSLELRTLCRRSSVLVPTRTLRFGKMEIRTARSCSWTRQHTVYPGFSIQTSPVMGHLPRSSIEPSDFPLLSDSFASEGAALRLIRSFVRLAAPPLRPSSFPVVEGDDLMIQLPTSKSTGL